MIKVHLFSGFENERMGIGRDTPLGHLYSDSNDEELLDAARSLGIPARGVQHSRGGFCHIDLWGPHLDRAKLQFKIVDNHEIYRDMKALAEKKADRL
jgi:hypothetical protein